MMLVKWGTCGGWHSDIFTAGMWRWWRCWIQTAVCIVKGTLLYYMFIRHSSLSVHL